MIKFFSILLVLVFTSSVFAQIHLVNFNLETRPCPSTGELLNGFKGWDIFQTEDGLIDGNRTDMCFNASSHPTIKDIDEAIDGSPIFIKSTADLDLEFFTDYPMSFFFSINTNRSNFCNCKLDCQLEDCFSVKFFFSAEIDGKTVFYDREFTEPSIDERNVRFQECFVLNKGENIKLHDIEITITKDDYSIDEALILANIFFIETFGSPFVNHVIPNSFFSNAAYFVDVEFFNNDDFGQTLVLHKGSGLPSLTNRYYYDIVPEDSTSQQTMNIFLTLNSALLFQDFTHLRPALVAQPGNDSLRHKLNIINEGATLCFGSVVEIISGGEDKFIHKSGNIDFHSPDACLQFNDKAEFVIAKGATFDYGHDGVGLLALNHDAQIVLEPNATLNFNGQIVLKKTDINNVQVSLEKNTTLKFGSHSSITSLNDPSEVQITIFLKGGQLDVSELDDESLAYLNIVEEVLVDPKVQYIIYPNPTSEFIFIENYLDRESTYQVYNFYGNEIKKFEIEAYRNYRYDVSVLNEGYYFFKSQTGLIKPFIIIR